METAIAMKMARNDLISCMLAILLLKRKKKLLTGVQPALQRFWNALGQLNRQLLEEAQYPSKARSNQYKKRYGK